MLVLALALLTIFLAYWIYLNFIRPWYRNREFRRWCKRPHIRRTLQVLQQMYQGVDAFAIARKAWQQPGFRDYAFIYGEIDVISFIAILESCQQFFTSGGVFYDLGSGSGKAVLTAALAFNFKLCRGIELVSELQQLSLAISQKLPALSTQVEFMQADFLELDISEADVVFVNAACFFAEKWQRLLAKLQTLRPGTLIIMGSKKLPATHFKLLQTELRYMSWGRATVSIYQR